MLSDRVVVCSKSDGLAAFPKVIICIELFSKIVTTDVVSPSSCEMMGIGSLSACAISLDKRIWEDVVSAASF